MSARIRRMTETIKNSAGLRKYLIIILIIDIKFTFYLRTEARLFYLTHSIMQKNIVFSIITIIIRLFIYFTGARILISQQQSKQQPIFLLITNFAWFYISHY